VGTVYAHHRLVPLLPGFMAAYPEVERSSMLQQEHRLRGGWLRSGHPAGEPRDGRIIARKLEDASLGLLFPIMPPAAPRQPPWRCCRNMI
jgi:DNA-binding transcriptional LysR family regulator